MTSTSISTPPHHTSSSSGGSLSGFPEEDLREGGRNNRGYFPARLGQSLDDGRYVIVRKLGWGQYSSVWLARDRKEDRLVALKILTCSATKALIPGPDQRSDEQRMLERIASTDPSHRGFCHTLVYYDSFEFQSAHGTHRCLVTEPLGYGADYVRELNEGYRIPPSTVKRIVRQVLLGLEYLHDVCGIVHADLKHDNILFRPSDLVAVVAHELVENPSITYNCGTLVNPPIVPVHSQSLPLSVDAAISERELHVVLADAGHSQLKDHHLQEFIQPIALRAPEVITGYPWSTPVDIWSLGCLVTEWLIGSWMFEPTSEADWGWEEDHLVRMTEALGASFEPSFIDGCQQKTKFFKPDGTFAHFTTHEEPTWPLRKLLEEDAGLGGEELDGAESFIRRCLQLTPEKRATATELLEDPWLSEA